MQQWELLINIMQDKDENDAIRDDAIIDLYKFNNECVIKALIKESLDENNNDMLRASCGETLGQIWIENDNIDFETLIKLKGNTLDEVIGQIKHNREDWYKHYLSIINEDCNFI
ncbi:hypothetical protein [Paenibacillus monticola]|uniref:HEAT repeat domain-containing protein n=1 Tax=Paenibacillus monticola TaxID=2666075 RepID=A0A7X2L508_9BACL|nr:hypothetical protein [Paenibacillus monticola]MRN56933.1 hypothetical protein [Paenibacillus monticola]